MGPSSTATRGTVKKVGLRMVEMALRYGQRTNFGNRLKNFPRGVSRVTYNRPLRKIP